MSNIYVWPWNRKLWMTANETLLLWVDWLDFYFYTNICRDYLWYDCSDDVFPFTLTDDGVYANTEPMKIIVPLKVKEKNFELNTDKKLLCTYALINVLSTLPKLHDKKVVSNYWFNDALIKRLILKHSFYSKEMICNLQ